VRHVPTAVQLDERGTRAQHGGEAAARRDGDERVVDAVYYQDGEGRVEQCSTGGVHSQA
jgi:hypothetical protein